jgi:FKBP-type peptidyl-prolyl cis-trans isomerase
VRFLSLLVLVAVAGFAAAEPAPQDAERGETDLVAPYSPPWPEIAGRAKHTISGLSYVVMKAGEGEKPPVGQVVQVHYTGRLRNGEIYSSSYSRQTPYHFRVGIGSVIKGMDEMILDMRKGERRIVVIPPELAYGREGFPGEIPPRETLTIDMELLGF